MTPKLKTNLMALAVSLGMLLAGYGLGESPSQPYGGAAPAPATLAEASLAEADAVDVPDPQALLRASRGALKRQIAMPFVSVADLMPRRES